MNRIQYETALQEAFGDADTMLGIAFIRVRALESILGEMLADAETMNPPYRNETICQKARAILD